MRVSFQLCMVFYIMVFLRFVCFLGDFYGSFLWAFLRFCLFLRHLLVFFYGRERMSMIQDARKQSQYCF